MATTDAPPALRVSIGEDDVLLREGIVRILSDAGLCVVAQAGNADELVSRTLAYRPDVAIVDIHLRDGSCTKLARALKRLGVPFIVHSGMALGDRPPDLMDVPWLTKPAEPAAVLKALAAVHHLVAPSWY